jgi:hypothetical protein
LEVVGGVEFFTKALPEELLPENEDLWELLADAFGPLEDWLDAAAFQLLPDVLELLNSELTLELSPSFPDELLARELESAAELLELLPDEPFSFVTSKLLPEFSTGWPFCISRMAEPAAELPRA